MGVDGEPTGASLCALQGGRTTALAEAVCAPRSPASTCEFSNIQLLRNPQSCQAALRLLTADVHLAASVSCELSRQKQSRVIAKSQLVLSKTAQGRSRMGALKRVAITSFLCTKVC